MNIARSPQQFAQTDAYATRLRHGEQIIPRQDPVLWSDWTPDAPITQEEARQYDENGYLVRKDVFDPDEIRALIDASDNLRENGQRIRAEDLVTEPGGDAVRTIFRLDDHSDIFNRLARDARVAGIARFLLGDDVYLHQSRLNYKPGFTGKEFYWHSDFETWHAEDGMPRMRAVSASILLTDNSELNGPLMLVPGSQGQFIACQGETPENNHEQSLKRQEIGVPRPETIDKLVQENGLDVATGPAGTIVFFDCNTLHASNGNITPFPRSNAFFVFNAESNRVTEPFAANAPRPDYLADRGDAPRLEPVSGKIRG
ncbi:ectoine hydroxylase [Pseudooceanicola aestuarii]|uniref:ectoine hydroxylase n=1 Tax=Pseudooceanicola aestuarii TaxID=2697319 RepID=UPI0013D22386|nr:ectoine hydroxylase [Pseudooceanicola aestuarii]